MAILFGLVTILYSIVTVTYALDDNMGMFAFYLVVTCVWAGLTGLYAGLRR